MIVSVWGIVALWVGVLATPGVGLAPAEFSGDLSRPDQLDIAAAVAEGLGSAVPLEGQEPCDADCLAAAGRAAGVTHVVRVRVESDTELHDVKLSVVDVASGAEVIRSDHPCKPCGHNEVRELVRREVKALAGRLSQLDDAPARVTVGSTPAGATILVDGSPVGTAPLDVELPSGHRVVEVRLEGFEPQARTIEAVPGLTLRWSPRLHAKPTPRQPPTGPPDKDTLMPTGWALFGVGVASLATGATFLGLNGTPVKSRCAGDDRNPANGECRLLWTSTTQGAALTAIGAVLVVTGAVLAGVGHKRRRAKRLRAHAHGVEVRF